MSDEQRPIPEFLRPHLTQEQYDRLREYLKTPHTRVDLTMEEWDSVKNGQGWPKDCWTLPDLAPEGAELTQDYLDYIHERLAAQEPDPWEGLALEVFHDPLPARYNSLDEAIADMKEGTRKRAIRPLEKVGDRVVQRQEYSDAPIGVGVVMCKDSYQIAYETKSPSDQETKNEET